MVAAVLVSGCASGPTVRDVSTGEETAVIEGWTRVFSGCFIAGLLPTGLLPPDRAFSNSLIVDAGPVKIVVRCVADNPFGSSTLNAVIDFVSEAGHTYAINASRQDCMELLDATADGSVVACEPYLTGGYEDLSTTGETASIRAGEASSDKGGCRLFTWRRRESRELIKVDAGPVSINATCFDTFFGRPLSTARFKFVAEAGHTYTITATEKDCISLLDITLEETEIACEPYSNRRRRMITTVSPNAALIEAGGASKDKGNCMPTRGGRPERRSFIEVDAGPINIDAVCDCESHFCRRGRRVSSFDFVAEAGHTYTITATDKECMSLLDITSEEFVIACEPYRYIELTR